MKLFIQIRRSFFTGVFLLVISLFAATTVSAQTQPTISSFSPTSAAVGASMTITGTNFDGVTISNNVVYIGKSKATVTAASSTSLTVTVPAGAAGNAKVNVVNKISGLQAVSNQYFKYVFVPILISGTLTQTTFSSNTNTFIYGMASGDLDGDNKPDIVLTNINTNPNSLFVRLNTSSAGATGAISFANSITITDPLISHVEREMAMADLDGDGKLDIVAPNNGNGNIVLLKNVTSGTLSFTVSAIATGGTFSTTGIGVADLDGDGKLDIVSGGDDHDGSNDIHIYLNNSSGPGNVSFNGTATDIGFSSSISRIEIADFNSDGKPDIVVVSSPADRILVLRNTSSGGTLSFVTDADYTFPSFNGPEVAVAGDIDGDNKPDLVVASNAFSGNGNLFKVLLNTTSGGGAIALTQTIVDVPIVPAAASGNWAQVGTSLGDFDGDGKLDVMMTLNENGGAATRRVAFFTNTSTIGSVSFADPSTYNTSFAQLHGATEVADFNGDGVPDGLTLVTNNAILAAYKSVPQTVPTITSLSSGNVAPGANVVITGAGFNSTAANNAVYFGPEKSTPSAASSTSLTVQVPNGAQFGPLTVLNKTNFLSGMSNSTLIPAFTPNKTTLATTDLTVQSTVTGTSAIYGVATADLTNDGFPELVTIDNSADKIVLYPNISTTAGAISYGSPTVLTMTGILTNIHYPALADLDGNGFLDLVVPSHTMSTVGVFLNSGSGTMTSLSYTASFGTGSGPNGVAIGDLDGDGRPEIVTANNTASTVSVLRNIGTAINTASFAAKKDFQVSASDAIYNVALADIDGDGKLDIITGRDVNSNPGFLVVLINTSTIGNISFASAQNFAAGRAPWTIIPADIDGDGLIDLVTSNAGSSSTTVSVFRNTSSGGTVGFVKTDLTVLKENSAIAVADLNGDGKPDIVNANRSPTAGNCYTHLFPNTSTSGNISFGSRLDIAPVTGMSPLSSLATDMNKDGKPDIIVGNQGGSAVISVIRNTLIAPPVTQATNITISATGTTAALSWTNGSGAKRAVFVKQDNTGSAAPLTGTDYTASATFGSGTQIGSTGWYCVFVGTTNSVTVSGLSPSTNYIAMVTEFNDGGLSNTAQYNTSNSTNNPKTFITPATLNSITRAAASSTVNTGTVVYNVVFGSTVANLSTTNFSLTTSGVAGASVTAVSGTGSSFSVTVSTGTGDGSFALRMTNQTSLVPSLTNTLPFTGETYTIDKTAPTLSSVGIASSNSNPALAFTGNTVSLSFTSGETIATPTVTIAGGTASVTNTGGNNWTASYTMTGSEAGGTIAFNIAFSDVAGNAGTAVTATTNSSSVVHDKTAPTLTSVGIVSNNSNTALAFTGDIITLSFTSNETITTPTVTIAGGTAAVTNTSGNNWKATYTMTGVEAGGTIAFNISFSDLNSNAGTAVTSTTNSSSVTHDKTAPTLSSVAIASNNANTSKAKGGDDVTLSFTSSETITAPTVTMAGVNITATNTGGNNWKAVRHMGGADTDGIITFSIAFSDLNSNAGATVTATTNSSSVVYDNTRPTLPVVTIISNNNTTSVAKPGDLITLNFTANETIASPTVSIAGHTVAATNTSGNNWTAAYTMIAADAIGAVAFSIQASDLTGNLSLEYISTTNNSSVDFRSTALPINVGILSSNADATKAKTGDLVTVTISSPAPIVPTVSVAGHAVAVTNTNGNNWNASYTMASSDAEGTVPFIVNYTDLPGNAGTPRTENSTSNSSSVVFDKTSPTLTTVFMQSGNSYPYLAKTGDQVTVSILASEPLLTPVITIAGHAATVTGNPLQWTGKYTFTNTDTEGDVPISITYKDLSGNSGTVASSTTDNSKVSFDKTSPALSAVTIASDYSNTAFALPGNTVTVRFTANETLAASPVVTIAGHVATMFYISGNDWKAFYTMANTDAIGPISFNIGFKDLAGNAATPVTATTDNSSVNFQLTVNSAPVFTAGASQTLTVCANAAATAINNLLTASDANSGQTLTWSIVTAPTHGTLTGFPATAASNGSTVTPSNTAYQPAAGYSGTDAFVVRVSDGIANADITISVTVSPLPSGNLTAAQGSVLCGTTGTVVLTVSGGSSYNWFRDGAAISGTTAQITVNQTGVYTAILISAQGCSAPASGSVIVTRVLAPVAQFSFALSCVNIPVLFTNQSQVGNSGTVTYNWTDNNGHSSTATSPTFTYTQTGNFDVKLKVTPQACPAFADSIAKTINIVAAVAGQRLPTIDVQKNKLTQLQARAQAGASYNWIPSGYLTSPSLPDPQVSTPIEQDFRIIVSLPSGCTTTDSLLVRVQDASSSVFLPNVFTPNGDGQNDKLVPTIVASIKTLRFFRVFNRWGKMLYETTQIGQGWDGRYNGELQPLDTYTWVIEGTDANGQLIKKQGSVTLLR